MSEEVLAIEPKKTILYAHVVADRHVSNDGEIPPELLPPLEPEAVPEFCDSDVTIAMLLQAQFDQEYSEQIKINEMKRNGLYKYELFPDQLLQEPEEETDQREEFDHFESNDKEYASMPACGYKFQNGKVVTKHDKTISARRNASKVMEFPPEFQTGDPGSFDMQLPNKVFNSLKAHSRSQQSKRNKMLDRKESHATAVLGVDEPTRLLLYKFVNNGMLEKVNGVIATGKESVVVHADSDPTYIAMVLPKECAIKIFKTTLNEFKTREKYIKDDYRFKQRFSKLNHRKVIHMWAEKEMHNMMRIQKLGLKCPEVICLKKHILVMSFIGENHRPAPQLREATLSPSEWSSAYRQVVHFMDTLYNTGRLVHADLSEYNILWHKQHCWFIDVSQSVEPDHPSGLQFMLRDCTNISSFFQKRGVTEAKSAQELFESITGVEGEELDIRERLLCKGSAGRQVIQLEDESEVGKTPQYPFEFAWDESQQPENSPSKSSIDIEKDSKRDEKPTQFLKDPETIQERKPSRSSKDYETNYDQKPSRSAKVNERNVRHAGLRDEFEEMWQMSKAGQKDE